MMEDPDREHRTHVVSVQFRSNKYYVVLSDGSEVGWDTWCNMSREERWNQ